ncbi:MAG: hypothetical protein EA373_10465, partial [Oceanospirillales bacterium]
VAETTVLAADLTLTKGDLNHGTSLRVAGEHTVTVGGDIVLGTSAAQFIAADSTSVPGILHLVLTSDECDVTIHAEVGRGPVGGGTDLLTALTITGGRVISFHTPIEIDRGMTIRDVDSVYFDGEVRLAGDLVIRAEERVIFREEVTLTNGGSLDVVARDVDTSLLNMVFRLEGGAFVIDADTVANSMTIMDASSVSIDGSLTLMRGDLIVQTDNLEIGEGASIKGNNNASLIIVALDSSRDVSFGVLTKDSGALSVTQDELARISGFGHWQLGHAIFTEQGNLQVDPNVAGKLYFAGSGSLIELDLLQLYGKEITLGSLDLSGNLDVQIANDLSSQNADVKGSILINGIINHFGSSIVLNAPLIGMEPTGAIRSNVGNIRLTSTADTMVLAEISTKGNVWIDGGVHQLASAYSSDRTNIFANTLNFVAAPAAYEINQPLQRIAPQLGQYRPDLLKVDANRILGVTDKGLIYNVIDDTTGHTYLYGIQGLDQNVYLMSMNNRADVSSFALMDMNLSIFEFFRFGMVLPEPLAKVVSETIQKQMSGSIDQFRATTKTLSSETQVSNSLSSAQRSSFLGGLATTPSLGSNQMFGIGIDQQFMQKLNIAIQPSYNLSMPFMGSKVINYYGDFQFWSTGEEVKDFFIYDFYQEEEFEF